MGNIETLSIAALAVKWRTPVDRLLPFVEHGYIRQVSTDGTPAGTIIQKPLPEVEDWIISLLGPLSMRVLLPISDLCKLQYMKQNVFHNLCGLFKIPLYQDPVFGEMMSPKGYNRFLKAYDRFRGFITTDRQTFVFILAKLKGAARRVVKNVEFCELLEDEIQRIIHLPEPQRTLAAGTLWKCYADADTFTDCLETCQEPSQLSKNSKSVMSNKMYGLRRAIEGKKSWDNPHKYRGNIFVPGVGWISRYKSRDTMLAYHERRRAQEAAAIAAQADESSSAS